MDLFLSVAQELGVSSDKDIATLADVGPENVTNWRSGAVKEFKTQKFVAAKTNLLNHLRSLRALAGIGANAFEGLAPLEIEAGSSPTDLQRQFRDRIVYDYCGHRFLYFEPQGALAWENLIKAGYEQDVWLSGVGKAATKWLDTKKDNQGQAAGPIARALRLDKRDKPRGFDVISLGPGEGGKEAIFLRTFLDVEAKSRQTCRWVSFAPVDVSIPLLLAAAKSAREVFDTEGDRTGFAYRSVLPFCADFEEGTLAFANRLRTSQASGKGGLRLVLILGNVMGNIRDEETFVRQKLWHLVRPGDLAWVEVGLRPKRIETDPLFAMTKADNLVRTASEANRRLLLEGPYRRLSAAMGRGTPNVEMRVWLREDDEASRVPGSCNFCHDLMIKEERRMCTMLYSRRYELDSLAAWFERLDFEVQGLQKVFDSKQRTRVGHILLRRKTR